MWKSIYQRIRHGTSQPSSSQDGVDLRQYAASDYRDPILEYGQLLSPRAMLVIRAIAEALFDDGEGGPPSDRLTWFEREINDFFASADGLSSLLLQVAPWALELSPLLTLTKPALFTQLSRAERQLCLERMEHSSFPPFGLLYLLCKALICLIYFEHPEALASLGFDGQCMHDSRPDHPLAGVFSV